MSLNFLQFWIRCLIGLAILCCFTHVRTVQSNESGLNQMLMVVAYARKKMHYKFLLCCFA